MPGTKLGIDLGTSKIAVYCEGEGVVLCEPAVIAVNRQTDQLLCGGQEALAMVGREPPTIRVVSPLEHGTISDYDYAQRMVKYFISKVCSYKVFKQQAAVSVPTAVTEVETRSVMQAITSSGIRQAVLIEEHVAAALGCGLDISRPHGCMVIDLGAGTTDIAVLALGGVAAQASIRVGGVDMDEAIIRMLRSEYGLVVGARTAEQVKKSIGYAGNAPVALTAPVPGRDAVSGLPVLRDVSAAKVAQAIEESIVTIENTVRRVLEQAPPELVGDIHADGIMLTGGAAQLHGLPDRLTTFTGATCRVAEQPETCVAIGTGRALRRIRHMADGVYSVNQFEYDFSEWAEES